MNNAAIQPREDGSGLHPICPVCWYDGFADSDDYGEWARPSETFTCGKGHPVEPVYLVLVWCVALDGKIQIDAPPLVNGEVDVEVVYRPL